MVRKFKYDVVQLIEGVRDRPCLWNKRLESYKDRIERRSAWEEIFLLLDSTYEDMTAEEKRMTEELVLQKWSNIRDTFIKTLKPHLGKPKKRYLYHDQLKFLTAVLPEQEYHIPIVEHKEYSDVSVTYTKEDSGSEKDGYNTRKKRRKKHIEQGTERDAKQSKNIDLEENYLEENLDEDENNFADVEGTSFEPRLMNEDEAFFASLLPTVVKYNEDERLEFRIEVLNVMKKIKEKRQLS